MTGLGRGDEISTARDVGWIRRTAWISSPHERLQDTLVLVYNMACPLQCDFCCHPVEQYGAVKTEPAVAIDWIRQAKAAGSCKRVVFTGGEPFLYYKDLLHIFEQVRDTELPLRIVTAAHWAESVEVAVEKLRPLVALGLDELTVSSDPSHQKFVPARYAENAARGALQLGIVAELASVFWDPDQRVEDTVDVPLGAVTHRGLAVPIGRGRKVDVTPLQYRLGPERHFGCGKVGNYDATIYTDGEVYPCCSGGFNIEAKLSFGNVRREPLADILGRMHSDRYTRLILSVGLGPIWELAELRFPEIYPTLPSLDPYVSMCQACARVHADSELMERLEPILAYAETVFSAVDELHGIAPAAEIGALTTIHP